MQLNYKSIGHNIRKCREAQGIKREKLPKLDTFIRIANTLQVSSDVLLAGVLSVQNQIVASELSRQLASLPASEQNRIMDVLKTMLADAQK